MLYMQQLACELLMIWLMNQQLELLIPHRAVSVVLDLGLDLAAVPSEEPA